jgi:hypothetical protein
MAQVTGGTDFDVPWNAKLRVCLRMLQEVSNEAANGRLAIPVTVIVAMLLRVLACPVPEGEWWTWKEPRWPLRFIPEWAEVTKEASLYVERLKAARPSAVQTDEVSSRLVAHLQGAIQEWAVGHPETPPTRDVLHGVVAVLWAAHLVHRPPSPSYPRTT